MSKSWVVVFDDTGIDALIPWTDIAEENMISKLSGDSPAVNVQQLVARTVLRAQLNGHRNMEIWGFNTKEDMSVDNMLKLWKVSNDVTPLKDLVRSKGNKIY
ncbi:hypothetical protein UFOVP71_245 [uncultured Caudovirales phage]|uniref:Uncharacterized protein n=1 Tax=uncultured Caudovirales phage TaxID=2100421 RepID=A0A6J5TCN4_9CAUD|nr:hypothetical protein UFOVP71_245 [uncultured Caudovirales phage]